MPLRHAREGEDSAGGDGEGGAEAEEKIAPQRSSLVDDVREFLQHVSDEEKQHLASVSYQRSACAKCILILFYF